MDYQLLQTLCAIPGTAGDEGRVRDFVVDYLSKNASTFVSQPKLYHGPGFQDMVIAVFGEPRTAVFAHLDTVGFTAAYDRQLYKIGNPKAESGAELVGTDLQGEVRCTLEVVDKDEENSSTASDKSKKATAPKKDGEKTFRYTGSRDIAPGTALTYAPDWKETEEYVSSAYLDNRLGVWNALQLAANMEHGALVFSTYEEHGGGGAQFAGRFLQENYEIHQALISDVTLVSDYIKHDRGVAISMRDRGIPRRSFVDRIIQLAERHGVNFQLEVEKSGGSDGNALQDSSYAWDWCFIGPPEANYHCPGEKVFKSDIEAMRSLYDLLLQTL